MPGLVCTELGRFKELVAVGGDTGRMTLPGRENDHGIPGPGNAPSPARKPQFQSSWQCPSAGEGMGQGPGRFDY